MSARRASDVFVECLEAEGVRYVFGIPGEETLDLNRSLQHSSISALDCDDPRRGGTVGLHERDYALAGFEEADVVIAVGYDLVEHAPEHWNPRRDKSHRRRLRPRRARA